MKKSPVDAYASVSKDTMSGRELEAYLLTKAMLALKECRDHWDEPGQFERLDEALQYNMSLWTIFQAELLDNANPLPQSLRQDLLNLSGFIDKRTIDVMSYPEKSKLDVLININRNIAEGLEQTVH